MRLAAAVTRVATVAGAAVVYPPRTGAIDVRSGRDGDRGDGVADDTAAVQRVAGRGGGVSVPWYVGRP